MRRCAEERGTPGRSSLLQARDDGRCHLCQPGVHARRPPLVPSLPGRGPRLGSPGGAPIMQRLTDRRPSMYARRRHRFAARPQMGTLATCNASVIQTPTLVRRRARDRPTPTGKSSGRYPASATTGLQRSFGHNRTSAKHSRPMLPKPLPLRRQQSKERTPSRRRELARFVARLKKIGVGYRFGAPVADDIPDRQKTINRQPVNWGRSVL